MKRNIMHRLLQMWVSQELEAALLTTVLECATHFLLQAFEVVTRPALDSVESALDRMKYNIYTQFAAWGLPCPITGQQGKFTQQEQQPQPQ